MTGRFAPTPSGRMHIGNMTAMLAAWLDSRARGQRMLLRIEDIDTPRVLPDADRWIMDDLDWLGLDWDGEPVYQSQRIDLYEQALRTFDGQCADDSPIEIDMVPRETPTGVRSDDVAPDTARIPLVYPCFCSRADIRAASAPQEGDGFQIYPGTCRRLMRDRPDMVRERLARGDRHSLRIAMPDIAVSFDDAVFGPQSFDLAHDIGDSVIRRSDGLFGYQFVVTVDDLAMGVDSIVRGRDLLHSTALQTYIRERLIAAGRDDGAAHPAYAHIPLIDNAAGRRLAKRERSLDMGALRSRGVTAAQVTGVCAWLLRLAETPEPIAAHDLLDVFRADGWKPLRAEHADRRLDPDDPLLPRWLADAV
ncbi:glutamyl-Q tRNA(Asp) synthetase [Bifidobacterium stellenboschense]|uniref:Glutamyl-Q tRNA(Asp) ligase n=1 Tax=Bifidobacterium stellenboschense TaxID=762211 RepID=A0A087DNG1_9BIFI|nr:glutamyl-Q tRNA(Asp) synthetase [Bifidobacterium stellenboschense]KFI97061.1 glutamyl-Q tRNA(Asp) ligase [Bifidobacterium stellenboschense]